MCSAGFKLPLLTPADLGKELPRQCSLPHFAGPKKGAATLKRPPKTPADPHALVAQSPHPPASSTPRKGPSHNLELYPYFPRTPTPARLVGQLLGEQLRSGFLLA